MTLSQRLEKIKENWIAIIISLLAATFLYFYYQINQLQTTSLYIPLNVESDGNLLLVNNIPTNVKITVKGKPEEISKITERDITAYLNLNYYYEPGKYNIPIDLKLSTLVERMNPLEIKIKPESMELQLEKKTIEYVPVAPKIIGTVAPGYEISSIEVEPKNVRIVGPYSAVTHTTEIETNAVDISNITENTEFDSYFVNKNKLISIDEGNTCTVKVSISEILENKGYKRVYFGGVTMDKLKEKGLEVTPENEKMMREKLREDLGMGAFATILLPKIKELSEKDHVVLDGLYSWDEYKILNDEFGKQLVTIAIVCDKKTRYNRLKIREVRPLSKKEAEARDLAEIENIAKAPPIAYADYYILNNSTLENYRKRLDEILNEI